MLSIMLLIINLGLNIWELKLLYDLRQIDDEELEFLNNLIQMDNENDNDNKNQNQNQEIIHPKNRAKRTHVQIAKTSFTSPLDPYEKYKDKVSNLYEPRRPSGGIRIEVDKD